MAAEDGGQGALTGHMRRAERDLRRYLAAVDVVWEVADARCPRASRNPRLLRLCGDKPRVLVLTKRDLAEPEATGRWLRRLRADGPVVALDLRGSGGLGGLWAAFAAVQGASPGGAATRRALVVGVPNTGKSTLLNRVTGGRHAAVGAAPGVTRGPQWLRVPEGGQVLDLPGVLLPRLGTWPVVWRLWAIGALGARSVDEERAGASLIDWLLERRPSGLLARYGLVRADAPEGGASLRAIARRRGLLGQGGVPDGHRAASVVLADFRRGDLGPLTLEDTEECGAGGRATANVGPVGAGSAGERGPNGAGAADGPDPAL